MVSMISIGAYIAFLAFLAVSSGEAGYLLAVVLGAGGAAVFLAARRMNSWVGVPLVMFAAAIVVAFWYEPDLSIYILDHYFSGDLVAGAERLAADLSIYILTDHHVILPPIHGEIGDPSALVIFLLGVIGFMVTVVYCVTHLIMRALRKWRPGAGGGREPQPGLTT